MRRQSVPVIGPYPADHPAGPATRVALRLCYLDDVAIVSLNADGGLNVTVIDTASTSPCEACGGLAPGPRSDALDMTILHVDSRDAVADVLTVLIGSADDGGYSDDDDTDINYDSDYDDMPPLVDLSDDDYSHLGYTFVCPLPPTPMNE